MAEEFHQSGEFTKPHNKDYTVTRNTTSQWNIFIVTLSYCNNLISFPNVTTALRVTNYPGIAGVCPASRAEAIRD